MADKKVALVTGGSRGIGKAIVLKLAKEGYNIIFTYASNEVKANEVKEEVIGLGAECHLFKLDIRDANNTLEVMEEAFNLYNQIDLLVNNAGITKDQLVLRMSTDDFADVVNVNLNGAFNCVKGISKRLLKQRKGKIINISSVVGITGNVGQCNYSASKAGMIGMTKSLAKEFAKRNIQVNAVAPGFIQTDMTDEMTDQAKAAILNNIPLGTLGEAEDVANLVAFLGSDQANYITGQVIAVDGGMTY